MSSSPLHILPLGGLGEIGMNCMVLEYEDEIIVVDCGLMFTDLDHLGVEFAIPDFTWLRERKDKVSAILVTHGHEDHIGGLAYLLKAGVRAPIFASGFSTLLIRERLREQGLSDADIRTFGPGERMEFRHFSATPVSVNHSIVDAFALMIDTPLGRVIHTGDFKIDPTPFYGSKLDEKVFQKAGEDGVLLLMSDSTNVERHEHSMSENRIYHAFEQIFAAAEGLTIIAMFASNVARMGQVLQLAARMGKKVAVAGRSMEQNARLAQELGYLKDAPSVLIDVEHIDRYSRRDVIVLSGGSQAEQGSTLTRLASGEHRLISIHEGDTVVMSSRYIPGNEKAIGRMINNLFKQGAEVLYEAIHEIHTSGHATKPELRQMLEWTKPRFFLPVHGEYRHLVHHGKLARDTGMPRERVMVAQNGELLQLTKDRIEKVGQLEETRVLVASREGTELSKMVLKERRQIGEAGVVFALMIRNRETRRIVAGPELISKGMANESIGPHLLDESKRVVRKLIVEYEADLRAGKPEPDFEEIVRVELRRFFERNIGKRPVVVPMIVEL